MDALSSIPVDVAQMIPKALHRPIMVFAPEPEPEAGKHRPEWALNSLVILTNIEHNNQPLFIILQMDIQVGGRSNFVHKISSSYERPNADVKKWIEKGLLRMVDKEKGFEWLRSNRLYMHADGTSLQSLTSSHTVLLKSQNVNYMILAPSVRLDHRLPILTDHRDLLGGRVKANLHGHLPLLRKSVHQSSTLHDKRRIDSNNNEQHLQNGIDLRGDVKPPGRMMRWPSQSSQRQRIYSRQERPRVPYTEAADTTPIHPPEIANSE